VRKEELLAQYEATGDPAAFELARRLYEEAVATDPENARDRFEYAYLLECRGRELLREAVAEYERVIAVDDAWPKAHLQLILARAALHDALDSIPIYEDRLRDDPESIDAHVYLTSAYLAAGDAVKARTIVEHGLVLAPEEPRLVELLGDVCAASGRPDEAVVHWERAFDLDGENLSPLYSAAFLLQREGRRRDAADTWRRIIAWLDARGLDVDAAWPRRELARLEGEG
jgi:tetratricopeptide (TPR) repeat protein